MKRCVRWTLAVTLSGVLVPAFAQETPHHILLRPTEFDPLQGVPAVPSNLSADSTGQLFIVQFNTQPTQQFRQEITTLGGTVYGFVPNQSHIVKMNETVRAQVVT